MLLVFIALDVEYTNGLIIKKQTAGRKEPRKKKAKNTVICSNTTTVKLMRIRILLH